MPVDQVVAEQGHIAASEARWPQAHDNAVGIHSNLRQNRVVSDD